MPTHYSSFVTAAGIPIIGSGSNVPVRAGKYYFVDGTNGSDGNDGSSMNNAKKTVAAAITLANADAALSSPVYDDVILVMPGTYTEAASTITATGLAIIGIGCAVKTVNVTSAIDVTTFTVNAANCEIAGIYFKCPAATTPSTSQVASISLGTSASYLKVHDCCFQGTTNSVNAIYSAAPGSDNVTISNNQFMYMNTATYGTAIYAVDTASNTYSAWRILDNIFDSCVRGVITPGRIAQVVGNHFAVSGVTAAGVIGTVAAANSVLSLAGQSNTGNVGACMVHGNYFAGTYSKIGGYVPAATSDDWSGNFVVAGITTAIPT
jgi:hypothetical protein